MKRTLAMLAAIMLPFVAMSASYTNSFVRNGVTYVQRGGLTVKDYVVTNITSSGSSNMTTNDVCNIVTNEISEGWSEWHYKWYNLDTGVYFPTNFAQITWNGSAWEEPSDFPQGMWPPLDGDITDANVSFFEFEDGSDNGINATRQPITRNALGLSRLIDLPPLTNDVPSMISSAAQAAISTNNPAFVAAVTNCPVVIAAADGTTIGEFGEYGTLGALLAALAAAITWLKANKADASSLPYALVDVTPTAGAPFVLAECFPIKYMDGGSTVTISATDAGDLDVDESETPGMAYEVSHNGTTLFGVSSNGFLYVLLDMSVTFGDPATTPSEGETQVFGFTPTAQLTDRSINAVSLTADASLVFPAQTADKARDFVVRLTLTETNDVVPSVTFPADVAYETEGGEWPDLTEAGTYIVRLTEVPKASESETARFFLQCSSAVADATPPSAGGGV